MGYVDKIQLFVSTKPQIVCQKKTSFYDFTGKTLIIKGLNERKKTPF